MKFLLAVSGGVDSVVLLDLMLRSRPSRDVTVAHVDHGIRAESANDARFVQALAKVRGVNFVKTKLELGPKASEEAARAGRYEFLFNQATQAGAKIVTAHHGDDAIGSIAINLRRGTGWRGLAVMNRAGIVRPLLGWQKSQMYRYACRRRLEWVEDESNQSPQYLRNRLRAAVVGLDDPTWRQLLELRSHQLACGGEIDAHAQQIIATRGQNRYLYTMIDPMVAQELLRAAVVQAGGPSLPRPQLERGLIAIKTARPGTVLQLADAVRLKFSKTDVIVCTYP